MLVMSSQQKNEIVISPQLLIGSSCNLVGARMMIFFTETSFTSVSIIRRQKSLCIWGCSLECQQNQTQSQIEPLPKVKIDIFSFQEEGVLGAKLHPLLSQELIKGAISHQQQATVHFSCLQRGPCHPFSNKHQAAFLPPQTLSLASLVKNRCVWDDVQPPLEGDVLSSIVLGMKER